MFVYCIFVCACRAKRVGRGLDRCTLLVFREAADQKLTPWLVEKVRGLILKRLSVLKD